MSKLDILKTELEARLTWLDGKIELEGMSSQMITYFMTRKRTFEQIINRINELEKM